MEVIRPRFGLSRIIIGARRRRHGAVPPPFFWPSNKVLKPNFQSIISQTNNGCSFFSLILAKLLLLDISCNNILALSVMTAHSARPFPIKKRARMSVFSPIVVLFSFFTPF